jgi:hypothetical protein
MEKHFRRVMTESLRIAELSKIRGVLDMMVSSHAHLRDKYSFYSFVSTVSLFLCSALLCSVSFADGNLFNKYCGNNYSLYIGLFSVASFVYGFIDLQLDWRGRADSHKIAFTKLSGLKLECVKTISNIQDGGADSSEAFVAKYKEETISVVPIPEREFLNCKKRHRLKVLISKHLDEHPGTIIWWFKLKIWVRDNVKL